MSTTVPKNNLVPSDPFLAVTRLVTFSKWAEATQKEYRTSGLWKDMGFSVRNGEKSRARMVTETRSLMLYHKSQVRQMNDPQKAERLLIARFIKRYDYFGLRHFGTDIITQRGADTLRGSFKDLVYKSFNYGNRAKGVRVPALWPVKPTQADGFYVRAGEDTDWFVLDVDNHEPTPRSTEAHLRLVERLVGLMPSLVATLGGGSTFYDYRQDAPQGIHIWVMLKRRRPTESLRKAVRTFLQSHADASLDALLNARGLKKMGALEILPSERLLIRLFGTYDRRVFTTEELKPLNKRFNARGLLDHIQSGTTTGNPCRRYGELAVAGLDADAPAEPPAMTQMEDRVAELTREKPSRNSCFFTYLVDACLNGVRQPDILFEAYLSPIARGLYFRDLHNHPNKRQLVVTALMKWLEMKHNGLVTRIAKNKRTKLLSVVRHIVNHLDETPETIQNYWASVRRNDANHQGRVISLIACMEKVLKDPVEVTTKNLSQIRHLLHSSEKSDSGDVKSGTYNRSIIVPLPTSLPPTLEARLLDHLGRAGVRKGKRTERILTFARRLIFEIGVTGTRQLSTKELNSFAGLKSDSWHIAHWKKLLVGAGFLEPGYKHTYKSKCYPCSYTLTDWVVDEIKATSPIPRKTK